MELTEKQKKELKKRELILSGNMWKAIIAICLPIMFYNLCNYFYGIYDMMVVQSKNIGDAADIVVLDQIKNMISTIGGALATGGGIYISRKFGEKKTDEARYIANTLFTIALIIALLTLLFIPFGVPFLKLLNTDQSIIDDSLGYFNVQMLILSLTTINSTFIAIEKSKGNTTILFILNIGVIITKISLTTLFAFGPFENVTITWLALATLFAQSIMFVAGLIILFKPSNALRIRIKSFNLNKKNTLTILKISLPVFIGRFLFHFGKVYLNAEASEYYDKTCVGALGISNTMAGFLTNVFASFEDGGSTIVSQNYGASNGKRIRLYYKIVSIYLIAIGIVGSLIFYALNPYISGFFAGEDEVYRETIKNIFKWECMDLIFTALNSIACSIFYGFGKTKITMALSMSTLFLFRLPCLLILMKVVHMNYEACGVAMFTSNCITGILAFTIATLYIVNLHKKTKYKDLFVEKA